MWIARLQLRDFRNYAALDEAFGSGAVLILGPNAQGKTNLLEALAVLATGQSHRESRVRNLVRRGAEEASLRAEIERADGRLDAEVGLGPAGRALACQGVPCERLEEYLGSLNVMLFHAGDVELVAGPAALRRRHLNEEIAKRRPRYLTDLADYKRCLAHRNAVLRNARGAGAAPAVLGPYTESLARYAEPVLEARLRHVEAIAETAAEIHSRLSEGAERLRVRYRPTAEPGGVSERLAELTADELRRGMTLAGPHRDDLELRLNGASLRTDGSRGQQKTAALALKLAEALAGGGDPAVPLLDDVMSELDFRRREALGVELRAFEQFFVNGTQESDVSGNILDGADVRTVQEGAVLRVR